MTPEELIAYNNGYILGLLSKGLIVTPPPPSPWYTEVIHEKSGLGDISIAARRQVSFGNPDMCFMIYIENGIIKTATAKYKRSREVTWEEQFSLGSGNAVAISFDGYWENYQDTWRMITSELPWLFWVDNNGDLYTQAWNDKSTRTLLSSGVTAVKAVRAWRNINMLEVDQGVVVGYIKADGVYYRNYAYQRDGSVFWENEEQVYSGIANTLNLFITNDYRIGFAIEDSMGKIQLHFTERAWAGMGLSPHYISAKTGSNSIEFKPIIYSNTYNTERITASTGSSSFNYLFASTYNEIITVMNTPTTRIDDMGNEYQDWGWAIEFEVMNDIVNLQLEQISVMDLELEFSISISSLESLGNNKYRVSANPDIELGMNNVLGNISITITGATNEAGYTYDSFGEEFTPVNLVPEDIPLPEVEAIWNE